MGLLERSVALSIKMGFLLLIATFSGVVFAADPSASSSFPDAATMLQNIAKNVPQIMGFVTALAYVMGIFFIIQGIVMMKHLGESRTMMSREHGIGRPLILIGVGVALLYLPSSVQVGLSTFWTDANPYGYKEDTDQWGQFLSICYSIIQLIGVIAFIRGLVMLTHERGHSGGVGQAFTHIIGGILCINIYQFVKTVMATLGVTLTA